MQQEVFTLESQKLSYILAQVLWMKLAEIVELLVNLQNCVELSPVVYNFIDLL